MASPPSPSRQVPEGRQESPMRQARPPQRPPATWPRGVRFQGVPEPEPSPPPAAALREFRLPQHVTERIRARQMEQRIIREETKRSIQELGAPIREQDEPPEQPIMSSSSFANLLRLVNEVQHRLNEVRSDKKHYETQLDELDDTLVKLGYNMLNLSDKIEEGSSSVRVNITSDLNLSEFVRKLKNNPLSKTSWGIKRFAKECHILHLLKECEDTFEKQGNLMLTRLTEKIDPEDYEVVYYIMHKQINFRDKLEVHGLISYLKFIRRLQNWKNELDRKYGPPDGISKECNYLMRKTFGNIARDFCWLVLPRFPVRDPKGLDDPPSFDVIVTMSTYLFWDQVLFDGIMLTDVIGSTEAHQTGAFVNCVMKSLAIRYRFRNFCGLEQIRPTGLNRFQPVPNPRRIIQILNNGYERWFCVTTIAFNQDPKIQEDSRDESKFFYFGIEPPNDYTVKQVADMLGRNDSWNLIAICGWKEMPPVNEEEMNLETESLILAINAAEALCQGGDPNIMDAVDDPYDQLDNPSFIPFFP